MGTRGVWVAVAAAFVAAACGAFASSDPESPAPACEGGGCGAEPDAGGNTADGAKPPVDCLVPPPSPMAPETCKCGTEGITQNCSLGVTNPPSQCTGGTQRCTLTDGVLRWSACVGATKPAAKETCFDDKDDDCDGKLNNGCACGDAPLCKDDAGVEFPSGDQLVLDKSVVTSGEKVNVFFLSRSALGATWLTTTKSGQTLCGGGGATAACPSSGCPGWNVERRLIDTTLNPSGGIFRQGPGVYTIKMRRGVSDAAGNCTTGSNTFSVDLTIN